MTSNEVVLSQATTLIFETTEGNYGKLQIKEITGNEFEVRFAIFNADVSIKIHSDGTNKCVESDFEIMLDKNKNKLKITPKDQSKCFVLGW
jgi:hypothetical protein